MLFRSAMLFIGGRALRAKGLELAGKIAAKTGCKVQAAGGTARIERGAGRVPVLRLHFVVETALEMLKGTKTMVLVGTKAPAAFFAYPGKPSVLTPEGCTGRNWHLYRIAQGENEITGYRCGEIGRVKVDVELIVAALNDRRQWSKGSERARNPRRAAAATKPPPG